MKSNYKRLGDYIKELKVRNTEEKAEQLLGINIDKFFMPSVANVVGTDLSVYKIVKKNQFACNRMHVGRDYRLPISMSKSDEEFMVSPAYDVFEIKDTEILNPEFLMMWFSRREFDRNAWFYTDADVRGGLPWKSFCDMQLPIPHPDKQREIVKEYNVIQNRIALNQELILKLEETAQSIYRQWFVEFEFPDEYGNPFKSNDGEMVWNEELGKEIPKGWEMGTMESIANQLMGFAFKGEQYVNDLGVSVLRGENVSERFLRWDTHKKWNDEITSRMEKCYLKENDIVIGMDGSKVGKNWAVVSKYDLPLLLAQRVSCLRGKKKVYQNFIFYSMCVLDFENYVSQVQTGTSIPHISGQQIFNFSILKPKDFVIEKFDYAVSKMVIHKSNIIQENHKLTEMKELLLSKLATIKN
jgi:type I restriction enzyme, S subunit